MPQDEPHHLLPDTSARVEMVLGVLLIFGGLVSAFFGVYDDLHYWGVLPVRWVMPVGAAIGVAMVADAVRRFGGVGATVGACRRWMASRMRWWLLGGGVVVLLGVAVTWEMYAAPQGVRVVGLPDTEVAVDIPGPEGYTHRIPAGQVVEFAVERGRHAIVVTVGESRTEHEIVHRGWPSSTPVVITVGR